MMERGESSGVLMGRAKFGCDVRGPLRPASRDEGGGRRRGGGGEATGLDASLLAPPFSTVSLQDIEVADADQ